MKKNLLLISIFFMLNEVYSQNIEKIAETELKSKQSFYDFSKNQLKSTNINNYDVTQYDLSFDLTDVKNEFFGVSKIYATIITDTNSINLDAQNNLNIESVKMVGNSLSFNHQNNVLSIQLGKTYVAGQTIEIEVKYNSTYDGSEALHLSYHNYNEPIISSLSEPYGASTWWVGADNLADKADVVNIFVRHDGKYKVGSNGILISREEQNDGTYLTHWKTSYPIPAYLISIGMSNYVENNSFANVGGTQVPIINYIYPEHDNQYYNELLSNIPSHVEFFSELIGEYPYKNEKYGNIEWNIGGGMEHATMSSQGSFETELTAHELAHQWFGDKITCATWSDIWLNEGFATYFEGLLRRNMFDDDFFKNWKSHKIIYITAEPGGSVYIPENQLYSDRIFSSRLSYSKGAMLLNMLKFRLGDDVFFRAIRNYASDPKITYGFATTNDLKEHLEQESGQDLTEFFNDWLYGEGYPIFNFTLDLNPDKKSGKMTVSQFTSHDSVDFFETPFEVKFIGENDEEEIRRFDLTSNDQVFEINNLPFQIVNYEFNPGNDIIARINNLKLGTKDVYINPPKFQVYPNPATNVVFVSSSTPIKTVSIINMEGKLVKDVEVNNIEAEIITADLAAGSYILQADTETGIETMKFIKK